MVKGEEVLEPVGLSNLPLLNGGIEILDSPDIVLCRQQEELGLHLSPSIFQVRPQGFPLQVCRLNAQLPCYDLGQHALVLLSCAVPHRKSKLFHSPLSTNARARIHQTLQVTPATAAGVTNRVWGLADLFLRE